MQSLPIFHIPGDKTETHIHTDRRIHKNLNLLTKAAFNAASSKISTDSAYLLNCGETLKLKFAKLSTLAINYKGPLDR